MSATVHELAELAVLLMEGQLKPAESVTEEDADEYAMSRLDPVVQYCCPFHEDAR